MATPEASIRVLIVDEQPLARFGLRCLLENDPTFEVVGDTGELAQLESLLNETQPNMLVVDPGSSCPEGVELLHCITHTRERCRIIILTSFVDRARIVTALEGGISGYLLKTSSPQEIVADMRRASKGGPVLAPAVADELMRHLKQPHDVRPPNKAHALSNRELEVLTYVAQGKSNRLIADSLHICEATVKFHVHAILEKLSVANRTEAALVAAQLGLVAVDPIKQQRSR